MSKTVKRLWWEDEVPAEPDALFNEPATLCIETEDGQVYRFEKAYITNFAWGGEMMNADIKQHGDMQQHVAVKVEPVTEFVKRELPNHYPMGVTKPLFDWTIKATDGDD